MALEMSLEHVLTEARVGAFLGVEFLDAVK